MTACCTLPPVTSCLFGTSDAAGGKVRIRPVESLLKEVNRILSVQLWPADRYDGFLSQRRAMMDFSPPLYEVLKPFLMDYLLLHLHLLYSVSLFLFFFSPRFIFINVSFTASLSDFLWISTFFSFVAFLFLVWFGLRLLCV